ncbi:hypothetical protein J1N35_000345 [Gossypium stocksii]|uniref:Uncharacterized protein n=1 Tax=Gossypium stocksii TaxID=47602 RepID=A0A9D3WFJ2_9ROSI|nr:hypothetical protein J1N35_000345 [Gossypium stocksii]
MATDRKIERGIGPLLRIDNHMIVGERGHYAYLCIQLNLNKPLPYFVTIKGYKQSSMKVSILFVLLTEGLISYSTNVLLI